MLTHIMLIGFIGLIVSAYALYVERKLHKNKNYAPVCDIHDHISCTKALSSDYARIAGLPNAAYGVLFYPIIMLLGYLSMVQVTFYLAIVAVLGSIYLAYVSYVKLKTFCVVCTSIYIVNIALLVCSYMLL